METKTKQNGTKKTVTRQKSFNQDVKDQLTKQATENSNGKQRPKK